MKRPRVTFPADISSLWALPAAAPIFARPAATKRSQRVPLNANASWKAKSASLESASRNLLRARKNRVRTVASGMSSAAAVSVIESSSSPRSMNTPAERVREQIYLGFKQVACLGALRGALRLLGRAFALRLDGVEVFGVASDAKGPCSSGAFSQALKRLVYDDADQPSGGLRFAAEICDGSESPQIGFLQRVLRFGIVLQDAARRPTEHPVVTPHELPECLLSALRHLQRELHIGQAICGCGGCCSHGGEGYRLLHYKRKRTAWPR